MEKSWFNVWLMVLLPAISMVVPAIDFWDFAWVLYIYFIYIRDWIWCSANWFAGWRIRQAAVVCLFRFLKLKHHGLAKNSPFFCQNLVFFHQHFSKVWFECQHFAFEVKICQNIGFSEQNVPDLAKKMISLGIINREIWVIVR